MFHKVKYTMAFGKETSEDASNISAILNLLQQLQQAAPGGNNQ